MTLYILLTIIAIGVLLLSEPGRALLGIILLLGLVGLVLYVGFYFVLFLLAIFFEYKSKVSPIFTRKSEYDWIPGAIFGVILLGAAVYKALYPLGYDKNRQIWTGKMKTNKLNELQADQEKGDKKT